MNDAMCVLTNNVLTFDMTFMRMKKGHEDEAFLSWFPEGFMILDEARIPIDDWNAKVAQNGVMFRIQAPFGAGARAIEQNERACKYLNSGDSFVVINGDSGFTWNGFGSNDDEKNAAEKVYTMVGRPSNVQTVGEGEESAEFWASVGGQGEYAKVKEFSGISPDFEPRLFCVSNASGYMWMEEVPAFGQEDLYVEDCFILDGYSTIYVWLGNKADKFEKKGAMSRAQKYLDELKDGRNKEETQIEEVLAGREPPGF